MSARETLQEPAARTAWEGVVLLDTARSEGPLCLVTLLKRVGSELCGHLGRNIPSRRNSRCGGPRGAVVFEVKQGGYEATNSKGGSGVESNHS